MGENYKVKKRGGVGNKYLKNIYIYICPKLKNPVTISPLARWRRFFGLNDTIEADSAD
jgi:hypothetical protein